VEITHPFHPLRGRRWELLKTCRVGDRDVFIVRRPTGGTLPLPREWTDKAYPTISELLEQSVVHDFDQLLSLAQLIEDIEGRPGSSSTCSDTGRSAEPAASSSGNREVEQKDSGQCHERKL